MSDHLLSDDPQFVDAAEGDLRLQLTSPAIDAGDNAAVPPEILSDLSGSPRFIDISWFQIRATALHPLLIWAPTKRNLSFTCQLWKNKTKTVTSKVTVT